jgi:nitroreductase
MKEGKVAEVIRARHTIHKYEPAQIDPELLRQAFELALLAPNHKLTFPWLFVQVGPETRKKLVDLDLELRAATEDAAQRAAAEARILNPAAMAVFCQARSEDAVQSKEDYAALSCSIESFLLFLTEQGYGTKWTTGKITKHARTYELLNVNVNTHEIVGFVWVGKPAGETPSRRRPLLESCLKILP